MIKPYNLEVQSDDLNRDNDGVMKCPACDSLNVHIREPLYSVPGDGRTSSVRIPMWCESNHRWDLVFSYHKGDTKVVLQNLEEVTEQVTRLEYKR